MLEFLHSLLPHIPEGVPHWWYYVCVGLAVLVIGVSKAGFGGGIGILAMPMLSLVLGPKATLGISLPVLVACDVFSMFHHVGNHDAKRLKSLIPGALVGVVIGTFILYSLGQKPPQLFDQIMNLIIGSICLIMVAIQAYGLTGRKVPTLPPSPYSAMSVGCFAGALSTINNGAGPVVTIYLLQEKLEKKILVGTLVLYFLLINTAKLPTYFLLPMADGHPLINVGTLHDSIWFLPLIPIGTVLGGWMHKRVPERPFNIIMYAATAITAGWLLLVAGQYFLTDHAKAFTAPQAVTTMPTTAPAR